MTDTRDELATWLYDAIRACESPDDVVAWADRLLESDVLDSISTEARKQLARELQERMVVAEGSLRERRNSLDDDIDRYAILRVASKEEGVRLARTYVEEELR